MFGMIKIKLLLTCMPAKETPNMGSKQFDCPVTLLHFKSRQSETFQEVPCLFLFDKPIKCFAFFLRCVFTFIFQDDMRVAL